MDVPPTDGGPPYGSAAAARLESEDVPCLRCGYNLRGLKLDGICPECGSPVERSLHGNLLQYSAPTYVATLHTGLICILLAILLLIIGVILFFVGIATVEVGFPDRPHLSGLLRSAGALGGIGLSILSVIGWWLFSTPDEAIVGHDTGDTPRKVLRIAVIVSACRIGIDTFGEWMLYQYAAYDIIEDLGSLLGWLAWIVQIFASLLYVRWLAYRLPSKVIVDRATTYLWLLPLIYIVGFCMFFLGPLVAAILYLQLLNDVRLRIRAIQRSMNEPEPA